MQTHRGTNWGKTTKRRSFSLVSNRKGTAFKSHVNGVKRCLTMRAVNSNHCFHRFLFPSDLTSDQYVKVNIMARLFTQVPHLWFNMITNLCLRVVVELFFISPHIEKNWYFWMLTTSGVYFHTETFNYWRG